MPVLARAVAAPAPEPLGPAPLLEPAPSRAPSPSWSRALAPIRVTNRNTNASAKVRLYDEAGAVDASATREFMKVAASEQGKDERLPQRLVQLAVRASYHFGGAAIEIVSATRAGAKGKHGTGEALDFALEGVRANVLAAYLFGLPRVGVGIYTHPKTQYVHLDVREISAHWLDASPPRVSWREKLLRDPKGAARDAAYVPASDLPELAAATAP